MFAKVELVNWIDAFIGYGLFLAWYAVNEIINKRRKKTIK